MPQLTAFAFVFFLNLPTLLVTSCKYTHKYQPEHITRVITIQCFDSDEYIINSVWLLRVLKIIIIIFDLKCSLLRVRKTYLLYPTTQVKK